MQIEERSLSASLPDILDQALARMRGGESLETCLADYPQQARALEPLLRAGRLLRVEAAAPLPAALEEWLEDGARDFAAIAAQMAPKYARSRRAASPPPDIATLLDRGLARVRAGMQPAAAVAEYPDRAAELAPLLHTGQLLRSQADAPLPAEMETWLAGAGRRDFAALAAELAPQYARRKRQLPRPITMQRAGIAIALVVVMAGAVDTVSAESVPGDTLYNWKRTKENISLVLANDSAERATLQTEYAQRRLSELQALVASGDSDPQLVGQTANNLAETLQSAIAEARQAPASDVATTLNQILGTAKSTIDQAAESNPVVAATLDPAREQVTQIEPLPETQAVAGTTATDTPLPTSTPRGSSSSSGGGASAATDTPTASNTAEPTLAATSGATAIPPTVAPPTSNPGLPSATAILPADTPTLEPATPIPPTALPSDTPIGVTATATTAPTLTATSGVTNTAQIPTATPIYTTEPTDIATPTPYEATARPTRTPTDTPVPTDTPTDTPVPTDTPTDTPVPTDTPTDTATPVLRGGATDTPTALLPADATPTPDVPTATP